MSRNPTGQATVVMVGPDNKAVIRAITAERAVSDKWLVTGGLKPGDKVIVEGLGRIRMGQPIRPVPAGSRPLPPKPGGPGGPG